jgi:Spy/CpxP family protein refolding chaperone
MMIEFGNGKMPAWRVLLMAGILIAGGCALTAPANAQGRGGMGQRGGGIERQLSELTQVLSLTVDQQAQVKSLLIERREKMEALRSSGTQPTMEQMLAVRQDTNGKIRALLNDDQKVKFAAWQQQRMEQRRSGGTGEAPAAQPPNF